MREGELGRVYFNGEIIFKEGEKGEVMYVMQSGKVKLTKKATSGDITVAILQSGEIFGEMALFDRLTRSATATALGDASILSIDKNKLFSTINRDPTLVFRILETMSQRIRKINDEVTKLKEDKIDMLHLNVDVDEICNLILEETKNIIKADNGSVMLLDDVEKLLFIKAAFGTESEPKIKLSAGEGIAGDVLRTGRAELINNVLMDSRFIPAAAPIQSILCVPLRCKSNNLGVINMSYCSERLFTLDDLKLLHSLATHASIAIQNAMNFSKLQNATNEVLRHTTILER